MNITDYFPDYREIGFTKKSYGVGGHLRIHIEDIFKSSFSKSQHCFFLQKGCLVPYFIEDLEDGLVKFESSKNPEDAKQLVSKQIFLHKDQIEEDEVVQKADSFIIVKGYRLVNHNTNEEVGVIDDVVTFPQQEMAMIGDLMIPLNLHNVKGINEEDQLIFVEIPEGLLEING